MRSRLPELVFFACGLLCGFVAAGEQVALLVGINAYPGLPERAQLRGCVNDTELMAQLLTQRFGFPASNIQCVTDAAATCGGIVDAFQDRLIAGSKPGDLVVFYYSGHGTQAKDDNGDEDDGMDEALVPSDVKAGANAFQQLLRDDRLAELAAQLGDRHFVAILDCCHSGTGIRSLGRSRYVSYEDVMRETDPAQLLRQDRPAVTRSLPATVSSYRDLLGKAPGSNEAVLLAACRPEEKAQEMPVTTPGGQRFHGIFTATFCRILRGTGGGELTYSTLNECLSRNADITRYQHPQIEGGAGALSRPVLQNAAGSGVAPQQQPSSPSPAAGVAAEDVQPLAVHVAHYSAFFGGAAGDESAQAAIAGLVRQQAFVRMAASHDAAEASVYHGPDPNANGRFVVGVLLPNGDTSLRREGIATLDAASLSEVIGELRRIYLVNNLLRLRSADSGIAVTVALASGTTNLAEGDKAVYKITAKREGYITLINVDCKGGVSTLLPNTWTPAQKVAAGGSLRFPADDAPYEVVVQKPVGDEFLKVFLTNTPLQLPEVPQPGASRGLDNPEFLEELTRSVQIVAKSGLDFAQLGPESFSETSLLYKTY